jgi:hypothetical protein
MSAKATTDRKIPSAHIHTRPTHGHRSPPHHSSRRQAVVTVIRIVLLIYKCELRRNVRIGYRRSRLSARHCLLLGWRLGMDVWSSCRGQHEYYGVYSSNDIWQNRAPRSERRHSINIIARRSIRGRYSIIVAHRMRRLQHISIML